MPYDQTDHDLHRNPFTCITGAGNALYGLAKDGQVYKYCPATNSRYAFWTKLTDQRSDDVKYEEKSQES